MENVENDAIEKQVLIAFKLGKTEFMESFHKRGLIYMNSVEYFRDLPNLGQGDIFEGAKIVRNGKPLEYRDTIAFEKVFCMWHINNFSLPQGKGVSLKPLSDSICEVTIDTMEYVEFSQGKPEELSVVIVHNLKEFHNRLRNKLNENYTGKYYSNAVSYYNPLEKSEVFPNVFMKPETLQYQNELRYLVKDNKEGPLKIEIGSIEDIAVIHPVSVIQIKFDYKLIPDV